MYMGVVFICMCICVNMYNMRFIYVNVLCRCVCGCVGGWVTFYIHVYMCVGEIPCGCSEHIGRIMINEVSGQKPV